MSRRQILRQRLNQEGIVVVPGVYNALTAVMLERLGFSALYLSGAGVSATLLGKPDVGYVGLAEMTMMARYISGACRLPLISDADTGYGNAVTVMHTVAQFELAGAAGIHIEDQEFPKRCGHLAGKRLVSTEEMVGKIKAALHARSDPDFLVIARTDARGVLGVEEVVRRGNAYAEAGADVVMIDAALSVAEIEDYPRRIAAPLLLTLGGYGARRTTPKVPVADLAQMGYKLVVFPIAVLRAGTRAEWDFAADFSHRTTAAEVDFIAGLAGHPVEDWYEFVGTAAVRRLEDQYLPAEAVRRRYEGTLGHPLDRAKEG